MENNPSGIPRDLLGPDDLVQKLTQLPSSAQVLPRLMDILRDATSPLEDCAALIKLDSGIAARVLQMANSSYYGKRDRCFDVEEAVGRVGILKVYELVAYAATTPLLMKALDTYGIEAQELWRISVTGALAAEKIASPCGYDVNAAYTVGLLHTAGLVAIDLWAADRTPPLRLKRRGLPSESTEDEKRQIGFTNANVAAALLKAWKFSPMISEPIRWQYEPRYASGHMNMACVLHVAKWVRDTIHLPEGAERPPPPQEFALAHLRLTADELETYLPEVKEAWNRSLLLLDQTSEGAEPQS